jgi:putative transposase
MVERMNSALPIFQQCRLLALPRSSVYRKPAAVSAEELAIMALIDRQYLARPYYGSRRMAAWLATQGHRVNRKRVQRVMRLLGLAAIYQRPKYEQAGRGAQDLSLPVARARDRADQSGLVFRRHLHPDGQGLPLPGGDHGLGQPRGAGVASIEHTRRRFLCRSARGSALALWTAGDLQYRSGQPVHQ